MRYSYTNRKGEKIVVSEKHLETALELKLLLQKDSPSNRCSWAKHRQLMIKEGFTDSENSENYRKLINDYQREVGRYNYTISLDNHVDTYVLDTNIKKDTSKLIESYKELVGDVKWEKHEAQQYLREINKGKKDIVNGILFIEEVKKEINDVLGNLKLDLPRHTSKNVGNVCEDETRMVALITDWHIGAKVDLEGNKFNLDIAKQRINEFIKKISAIAYKNNVNQIDIVFMGDGVEGSYMRSSQPYDIEFPLSRQIAVLGQLLINMLVELSSRHSVTFRAFAGNHDRMNQQDKNNNISGDSVIVIVNEIVKTFIENASIDRLKFTETDNYCAKMNVNGKNLKFVHGDLEKYNDKDKIHKHSSRDGVTYDVIAYGHFHHFAINEVGVNRFEVAVGSLKGSDDYSEKLGLGTAPSQACILIDKYGDIDIKRISLN